VALDEDYPAFLTVGAYAQYMVGSDTDQPSEPV